MSRTSPLLFPMLLFWSAITLGFDAYVARKIYRQCAALSYPTATATILQSRLDEQTEEDGRSYAAHVRFAYEAGGRRHDSTRWRYDNERTNIRRDAQKTVDAFPAGSTHPVYVNPADPADAILAPGLYGSDVFFVLFLGPFNAVMLGGWVWVLGGLLGIVPYRHADFEHVQLLPGGALRIHEAPPMLSALVAFGGVCFVSIFVVVLIWGFNGPVLPPVSALTAALFFALLAYIRFRASLHSGRCDLVVDPALRRLTLPCSITKGLPEDLPFNAVADVAVSKGRVHQRGHTLNWEVRLRLRPDRDVLLTTQTERANADRLAAWLRDHLEVSTVAAAA